jgi:hypothetical protein
LDFKFTNVNQNKLNIDVNKLAKGAYYLTIKIGGDNVTRLFTVE